MCELVEQLRSCLHERDVAEVNSLLDQNVEWISENPWQIVPTLSEQLSAKTKQTDPSFFESCASLLTKICATIQPVDVLLLLIKEIEGIPDDVALIVFLELLRKALISVLSTKRVNYLAWCLNAILTYVNELPIPDNLNLEEEEKLMMDADPTVARISNLYNDMLVLFYEAVHEKVIQIKSEELKVILLRNYIELMGKPLVFLDMHLENKPKSKARLAAENILMKIIEIDRNIFRFLEDDFIKGHEDINIRSVSLASVLYLCLGENFAINEIPSVYNNIYIFQSSLQFIVNLLEYDNQFMIEKALRLLNSLLKKTEKEVFNYLLLDSIYHSKFCKNLSNVIIYSPIEMYRKSGLDIFKKYLYRFDSRGRYLLIYNIKKTINNTSLNAYITTQYKEMLVEQLDKQREVSNYFKGTKLRILLSAFCRLSDGVETYLIDEADQIIATLNLLRYLAIRDKTNVTNIRDYIKDLEKTFLVPLKTALTMSRGHYELKLKEITEENAHGDKRSKGSKVSVSIGGMNLPKLTTGEKVNVIKSSMTAFDVIESLLCRVNECLEL